MSNERELFEQFANEHKMSVLRVADAYSDDDTNYAWWVWQKALLNTPQTSDIVQSLINELETMAKSYDNTPNIHSAISLLKSKLSAYKPQADANTPPDVYDIVVDTGDGIYHTAEVVHFQQSGSKRMIQVRFGDTQADDVRKDAWISVDENQPPAHTEILLYREDCGVWQGQYTYCADWVSEAEQEIHQYDDATLFSMDYWSFDEKGAHRCEGDLKPTHWQPLPAPPLDKARE